ncbi:MAG: alpha/beta hydrolase family protein [Verrucomicrobiota bacterium]
MPLHLLVAQKFQRQFLLPLLISSFFASVSLPAAELPERFPTLNELPVRVAMPDPLVNDAGSKVETLEQWNRRREEMKRTFEYYAIGKIPPPPGNVRGRTVTSRKILNGHATCQWVRLTFGPNAKLELDLAVLIPAETEATQAQYPVVVQPSFTRVLGTNALSAAGLESTNFVSLEEFEELGRRYELPLKRGYAVATFDYQQCGADRTDFRQTGFFPAYPEYDWGTLAAWAWGMSRCVDYLQTQPFADASRFIAVGHSRLGKAALIAGAFDERFALTAPAGSGCGGTGAYRFNGKGRGGKEGLEDATKRFPQWFGPRLVGFSGHLERLPFDQHWLFALIAPRCCIAADGLEDPYANGNALAQSYLAAKPVYALLGVPDHLGIHFRPGGHLLAPEDWQAILDFSDQQLRGRNVKRRFDQLPPVEQLH